ncbi:hypothetical protein [uncultured Prevotella sp.]|uniref:hypothetical protein n=1 Tax=uncultured Prevotella sp. TaxID=159272 RepID=UPI0026276BA5|nr:hypothetical protein [uncultured Prevotella sp.]
MLRFIQNVMAAAALMAMPLALNAQTNYYVKAPHDLTPATPEGTADGSSWDKAISLQQALAKVKAGDCIFAKGYTAGEATGKDFYYTVPDCNGFVLPSGVRMYGGFAGNETEISPDNLDTQANDPRGCVGSDLSHMKYRSVLTADFECNDTVSDTWLLFPQNSTRKDNALHVVTMSLAPTAVNPNAGNDPTVLNGFYIVGGNASDSDDSYGGGVYITDAGTADNNTGERGYDVSRCFFTNNYAERGGAIYVAANVKPNANRRAYIRYNTLFNNVAGTRGADDNLGGGLWAEGRADIVNNLVYCNINGGMRVSEATTVVNNTISRNNSAGIDHVSPDKNNKLTVYNTIVWGNHRLNKYSPAPHFSHGAYYTHRGEANPGDDTNVVLEESNNAADGATPNFKDPVTSARYDRSYIWTTTDYPQWSYAIDYGSALIAKGDPTQYNSATWGDRALSADNRFGTADNNTTTIDIGAYAYTKVPASRRRYVKTAANGGNDDNDGLTWATAYASPQKAIDALNDGTGQRGEVWVAAGTYAPSAHITKDTNSPVAFLMHSGINVFGGFRGTETSIDQRDGYYDGSDDDQPNRDSQYTWKFHEEYRTIFQGHSCTVPVWNSTKGEWVFSSGSYHVVWFAPIAANGVGTSDNKVAMFDKETVLDGVTIEGGRHTVESGSVSEGYLPNDGAGVLMGENAILRDCVVRYCSVAGRGAAVYNGGGRVEKCLIYNNVNASGDGGGVYIDGFGIVSRCIIANNKARNGGGVYMKKGKVADHAILALSVVANNENTANGAVYADQSGNLIHNTIVNNYTSTSTDESDDNASHTGGVYVNGYCYAVNNIIWNNVIKRPEGSLASSATQQAQIYASNATAANVRFYNNALSSPNSAVWNNVYQSGTISLGANAADCVFKLNDNGAAQYGSWNQIIDCIGLQSSWNTIDYYWPTKNGASLRSSGLPQYMFDAELLFRPAADIIGDIFNSYTIGAYYSDVVDFRPALLRRAGKDVVRLYVDPNGSKADGDGSSWSNNAPSLHDALVYFENLDVYVPWAVNKLNIETPAAYADKKYITFNPATTIFEICLREGNIQPEYSYDNNDARSVSHRIPRMDCPLRIVGGYPSASANATPTDADRDIKNHRTEFDGRYTIGALSGHSYHTVRVQNGADVTFDGVAVTGGNATENSTIHTGAGVLLFNGARVQMDNCIIENNRAYTGPAVGATTLADNVKLVMRNCVINNNTVVESQEKAASDDPWLISVDPKYMEFNHVTIVNNIAWAPQDELLNRNARTSYALGNQYPAGTVTPSCNNTLSVIASLGKDGAANFSNPSVNCGAAESGNVYYGGNADYRPLTSSNAMQVVINKAAANADDMSVDIYNDERDLGGAPDLGAVEALLPKSGSVIYVRSYNTVAPNDNTEVLDETDGKPDFSLLKNNPGVVYNGKSWDTAIHGNAMCDTLNMDNDDNSIYVLKDGMMLAATYDNLNYSTYLGTTTTPVRTEPYYGPASGHYTRFLVPDWTGKYQNTPAGRKAWDKYYQGNTNQWDWASSTGNYNSINNDRKERYVSGLQLAVEIAAKYNALHKNDAGFEPKVVWVGAGVYTDYKGFVIRNGVKVYGGFPKEGTPGEQERKPLLSQYVPARLADASRTKSDYETILQIRKESPVKGSTSDNLDISSFAEKIVNECAADATNGATGMCQRHYVLYQPDVCVTTWHVAGDGNNSAYNGNEYRCYEKGSYYWENYVSGDKPSVYKEYADVKWDGFTVRHGYIINYMANRDGGAGVRVFHGVKLENLIITNNLTHGYRTRGGGLYMDGDNSTISNSFVLNNLTTDYNAKTMSNWSDGNVGAGVYNRTGNFGDNDDYGGGAYMIVGTGYNMVVANNRVVSYLTATGSGGGIFIENAKFYNNTVAYNTSLRNGAGIEQWASAGNATGVSSELSLYNCIVYGNKSTDFPDNPQVSSTSVGTFKPAHNCFLIGGKNSTAGVWNERGSSNADEKLYSSANGNIIYKGSEESSCNPFAAGDNARKTNDYRLSSSTKCMNGGTDNLNQNNEELKVHLPLTDMDYSDRIKDCKVDIGAYESDTYSNIAYETRKDSIVFYVTQTGYGDNSGRNPENAACAEKLQKVLNVAGECFVKMKSGDTAFSAIKKFVVKVAGYNMNNSSEGFIYHPNTLADPSDPQSYTYLIPDGVTLMGGYYEGEQQTVSETAGTETIKKIKLVGYNWYDDNRNVWDGWRKLTDGTLANSRTILSAVAKLPATSTVDRIVGHHAVTFGSWPTDDLQKWSQEAVSSSATIDGCFIVSGEAITNDGHKAFGGAAIVPKKAHVRNCVISHNKAVRGGGLYLMPGAIVSGTMIDENEARVGAGMYVDNGDTQSGTPDNRAYVMSTTIVRNTAENTGGGVFFEEGALMAANCVVWGNFAASDKNLSGISDRDFKDTKLYGSVDGTNAATGREYPFNDCFIETFKIKSNHPNISMTSENTRYFRSGDTYVPRPFSQLIHAGADNATMLNVWKKSFDVATYDMRSVEFAVRNLQNKLTVGAFAVHLAATDNLFTRLFVSLDGGNEVSADIQQRYVGRSFYTPFNSLGNALEYIRKMRASGKATDDTHFEILLAKGTYVPVLARTTTSTKLDNDMRMCSFSIPVNTALYGGFTGKELYCTGKGLVDEKFPGKPTGTFVADGKMTDILAERNKKENTSTYFVDRNLNNIIEPWEFNSLTILTGDLLNDESERAYHVVYAYDDKTYAEADKKKKRQQLGIVLDGITIQHGATSSFLDFDDSGKEILNEVGHGGGIYSNGVNVTLNRCRLIDNRGIHGGAAFIKDADFSVLGSLVAGNEAIADSRMRSEAGKGGALHFNYDDQNAYGSFYTANSLYVNNSAEPSLDGTGDGMGGAIYFNVGNDATNHEMHFMNSIAARNKATKGAGMYWNGKILEGKHFSCNSVVWGNKADKSQQMFLKNVSHVASDVFVNLNPKTDYTDVTREDGSVVRTLINDNIVLSTDNMAIDGPRFTKPTALAGVDGYDLKSQWNPAGISILTDAGDGVLKKDNSGNFNNETGSYYDFWNNVVSDTIRTYFAADYGISRYMLRRQSNMNSNSTVSDTHWTDYARYLGGLNEDGTLADKTIDIGLYEYQYKIDFRKLIGVYIGNTEQGDGDGRDWANQSSDLRSAIIAMANPDGAVSTGDGYKKRTVYVRGGEYFSPTLYAGNAFSLYASESDEWGESVTIKGACTGEGHGDKAQQDFSKQTVVVPSKLPILKAGSLLNVMTKHKPVTIEGLTFSNDYGRGLRAQVDEPQGSLTIRNGGFRENVGSGMFVAQNKGKVLIYNTVFASDSCKSNIKNETGEAAKVGNNAALVTTGKTRVVNATFVENLGPAIASSPKTTEFGEASLSDTRVFNSVSWQNEDNKTDLTQLADGTTEIMPGSIYAPGGVFWSDITGIEGSELPRNNKAFAYHYADGKVRDGVVNGPANADAMNGPNFTNPAAKDYTLRPSLFLLDRGSNTHYQKEVLGYDDAKITAAKPAIPDTEVELANKRRLVGDAVDVGAYEHDAQLRQILYVTPIASAENTGESWNKSMGDLQSAVDLAGLYSRRNGDDSYVFVDQKVSVDNLKLELDRVHVYGNMNGEKSASDETPDGAKKVVSDLLGKRHGAFESGYSMSKIKNLTIDADAVVDGFDITASAQLRKGLLGGALVECNVTGTGDGVLYNSLVYDSKWEQTVKPSAISQLTVSGVRAVNVSSQGTIENVSTDASNKFSFMPNLLGSYANRAPGWKCGKAVTGTVSVADTISHTRYVPSSLRYRCYQLNDDDNDNLDRWPKTSTQYAAAKMCIDKVGHAYDVLGNKRLRNNLDNGCFETWNVLVDGDTTTINAADYPHCPSVMYVRSGRELAIEDGVYPNPGTDYNANAYLAFLLLEHHAGLRSRNNWFGYMRLAVERDFENGQSQYVYMPFTVDHVTNSNHFKAYTYNAKKRAKYDYKYNANDGAWNPADRLSYIGLALVPNAGARKKFTARFYSKQLDEHPKWQITGNNLNVTLQQSNNRSPWSSPADGGAKFTHKENMGWNLFGSPYICSMNYKDMEYPRIAYWLNASGEMQTLNMNLTIDAEQPGHIPPFDAVFTQTATLAESEKFSVAQSTDVSGEAYASTTRMAVAIAPYAATRQASEANVSDEFAFQAVPHEEARSDYDMGADGVKWMSGTQPLIYAERNGGRYSLLSALDEEGEVQIGVSVPEAGMYVMQVPEGCDATDYEAVLLKDASTGKAVDLLEGSYTFSATAKGEQNNRFSIAFRKTADADASRIYVSRVAADRIRIVGLQTDDDVRLYLPNGMIANQTRATSDAVTMTAGTQGVVIVEVVRQGKQVCVRKLK